jgi:hypothetical protein
MPGKSFSAAEFIKRFRAGEFAAAPLEATGFVKLPEEGDGLLFSHANDCSSWVSVPRKLIDHVEFLRVVSCKDHHHPLVTLTFSAPESSEAQVFAGLAKLTQASSSNLQGLPSVPVLSSPTPINPVHSPGLTTFNMTSPSAHAFLQAIDDMAAPGDCPRGQRKVWIDDHWECVDA